MSAGTTWYMAADEEDLQFDSTVAPSKIIDMLKTRITAQRKDSSSSDSDDVNEDTEGLTDVRVQGALEKDKINFDCKMGCFLVRGTGDVVCMVKLAGKPTCSCRPVGSCNHILAVQKAIGLNPFAVDSHNCGEKPVAAVLIQRHKCGARHYCCTTADCSVAA